MLDIHVLYYFIVCYFFYFHFFEDEEEEKPYMTRDMKSESRSLP